MNILMTGGTGLIGSRLIKQLVLEGHHVHVLTRFPKKHPDSAYVSYISYQYPMRKLPFIHAVINLAGESLFGNWSEEKKARIVASRLKATEKLTNVLLQMHEKPNVFLSGSAIGYYGMSEEKIFTEKTTKPGDDFLASVCHSWEKAAATAEDLGIRTVYTRFGVVLDGTAGALPQMALPVKFGAGGKIGSGRQWMSWIHIDDCVNLLLFSLYNANVRGPLNVTAPYPKQNDDFMKTLGNVLKRPTILKTPALFFKIAVGEMHQLVTKGQYVYPQKALDYGYVFQYPQLEDALIAIYSKQ